MTIDIGVIMVLELCRGLYLGTGEGENGWKIVYFEQKSFCEVTRLVCKDGYSRH